MTFVNAYSHYHQHLWSYIMRLQKLLCLFLFCAGAAGADWSASANMPAEARDAIRRSRAEYEAHGAQLPRICYKWATKGQVPAGAYGMSVMKRNSRGRAWVIFINATDFSWPRWELAVDQVLLHETGHCLGWGHERADSVMEAVLRCHLFLADILRLSQ
jgi:hypothetical protein